MKIFRYLMIYKQSRIHENSNYTSKVTLRDVFKIIDAILLYWSFIQGTVIVLKLINLRMFGKHYQTRPHEHLIHVYSRVPYLDAQIFDIEAQGLRESRKSINRTSKALQGIQRTQKLSEKLSEGLKSSRKKMEEEDNKFLDDLKVSQNNCLERSRDEKNQSRLEHLKDQKYLNDLLLTNATKAASRVSSVRRWN